MQQQLGGPALPATAEFFSHKRHTHPDAAQRQQLEGTALPATAEF